MKKQKRVDIPEMLPVIPQRIQEIPLKLPRLEYKVVAQPILDTPFTGHVTTIPTVLIFYLHPTEFKVVASIIQDTMETGVCIMTVKQFSVRLKVEISTIYGALYCLRKMGIIYEYRQGAKVARAIDFDAVQHLNDLLKEEDRGIYCRLRSKMKLRKIENITEKDLEQVYDKYVLPTDHDIEEEEEYE